MNNDNYKTKGSITVETVMVFPIFFFIIVIILNFLNVFYIHFVMQQAINNTAKRLSEYSYLVDITVGVERFDWKDKIHQKVETLRESIDNVQVAAKDTTNNFSKELNIEKIPELIGSIENFGKSLDLLKTNIKSIEKEDIINGSISFFTDLATGKVLEGLVSNYFKNMGMDMYKYIEDVDFSNSNFYLESENRNIKIIVTYKYKNPFTIGGYDPLSLNNEELKIKQQSVIHPWIGNKK